jgi:hypothetical protein
MSHRLLLVAAVFAALSCAPAMAREARLAGPGGDGGGTACPEDATAEPEVDPTRPGRRVLGDKPVITRGAEPQVIRPLRWHSFLPGMFR